MSCRGGRLSESILLVRAQTKFVRAIKEERLAIVATSLPLEKEPTTIVGEGNAGRVLQRNKGVCVYSRGARRIPLL